MKKIYSTAFLVFVFFIVGYTLRMLNESRHEQQHPKTVSKQVTIQYPKDAEGGNCFIQLWDDKCNAEFFAEVPCGVIPQQSLVATKWSSTKKY